MSHQLKGEPRNAVCLDGTGHDDDSPNAASSDAARNLMTFVANLAGTNELNVLRHDSDFKIATTTSAP